MMHVLHFIEIGIKLVRKGFYGTMALIPSCLLKYGLRPESVCVNIS